MSAVAAIAWTLMTVPSAPPAPHCGLRHPERCYLSGHVGADPEFLVAMRRFVGDRPGGYYSDLPLWRELSGALLTTATDPVQVEPGAWLMSGCVPHFCTQSGAVIIRQDRIVGAALLYDACDTCGRSYRLDIFVSGSDSGADRWVEQLRLWAHGHYAEMLVRARRSGYGPDGPISQLNVHRLSSAESDRP